MGEPSSSGGGRPKTPPSVAFVTVSYGPDRDRCRLLCRSLDALGPPTSGHLIIVDRADLAQFSELESGNRRIVATEDVLPNRVWSAGGPPRRSPFERVSPTWASQSEDGSSQQLVKLAACRTAADIVVPTPTPTSPRSCGPLRRSNRSVDAKGRGRGGYRAPGLIGRDRLHRYTWLPGTAPARGEAPRATPQPDPTAGRRPALAGARMPSPCLDFPSTAVSDAPGCTPISSAWDSPVCPLRSIRVGLSSARRPPNSPALRHSAADYWGPEPLNEAQIEDLLDGMSADQVGLEHHCPKRK